MTDQTINGNNRSNILVSGAGDDTINAGGGNDLVISGAGDDTINGGRGNDIIISGSGDDFINGGSGNDIIISGSGDDTINGGSGSDIIISGSGDDTISGGSGNDLIVSGTGDDIVDAGSGHDTVYSGSGNDTINGGSGHDLIVSGSGDDTASGDSGNDTIISGSGNDTVNGNLGHDIIITGSGNDIVHGDDGHDIIVTGQGDDIVEGGNGHDVILSGNGADIVDGGNGDDVIITGRGEDTIEGGAGNDWIHAGADNDIINAGTGDDYINGGSEFDIAVFDGNFQDYTIDQINTNCYNVTHNASGEVDTVVNVELFRFSDVDIDPASPAINTDPLAQNDTASVDEDGSVVVDVLSNDSDLDGDALSVTSASASNGSVTINTDGTVTYTPDANFNGEDTISYEISDGNGGTSTAEVTVTVNAVNDGPVAQDDTASVDEDGSVVVDVLSNDSDLDGDALSVTSASASNGSVTINTDGTVTYTPDANFNGEDTISYEISDGNGGTSTAEVTVTVNAVNDGPVAQDDTASVDEDNSVIVDVLSNDSDLDGDALSVTSASASNGSVTINTDGTVTYTPDANFNGEDTISYEISDGNGGTSTAEVTVTVNAVNDGPVAQDDTTSVDEDGSVVVDVLSNDSDLDGDALTVTSATASNGSVTINTDGTVTYTPDANFNGEDTISYEISDGNGGTSTAEVTVTVNAVNDGPVAQDDTASVDEDGSVIVDVLSNDSDLDGDVLTVSSATASNGSVTINTDGTVTYTPDANFNGEDTISYEISDGNGGTSTAEVTVTVNAVNDGPVAQDDTASVDEDGSVIVDVLSNDSDLDGDVLTVSSATASNGSVTINTDGTVTYTPDANFNGEDTISYEISDGNGGTSTAEVTVTVNGVNDGPVAQDDTASVDEDGSVIVDVLSNDSDLDGDVLTVSSATASNGSVTINTDGTVTYTPDANFNGEDTISYEISDGNGGTSTAEVTVTVNAVNDGPVAQDDTTSVDEDGSVVVDVLSNDSDLDGDALSVTSASALNGSVTINTDGTVTYTPDVNFNGEDTISYEISDGNGGTSTAEVTVTVNAVNDGPVAQDDTTSVDEDGSVVVDVLSNDSDLDGDALSVTSASALNGSVTINTDGTVTYTPDVNFNGEDTISYEISDGNGGTSTAEVTVTVNAVNDGPVAQDDAASVEEDNSVIVDVLSNDSDIEGDTLSVTSATASNGSVTINTDGSVTYTPNADFIGEDTISYEISDGNGGTSAAEVTVTVNPTNDDPVALDDLVSVDEDGTVVVNVLNNDTDIDGDALSLTSATASNGSVIINTDGTVSYTPNANFNGKDTISYEISDGFGGTSSAEVTVTVNPVNDNPDAQDNIASVNENSSVVIDVLSNDSDLEGDSLTVSSASAANGNVVINADGTITYTPDAEFNGQDTIAYEISDGQGGSATAQVFVTVNVDSNTAPVALDDDATVEAGTNIPIANFIYVTDPIPALEDNRLLANDSDADGDTLTITHVDGQSLNGAVITVPGSNGGFFKVYPNGQAEFDATSGFENIAPGSEATSSITYTVSDGQGGTDTATVTVTIRGSNDAPVAVNDSASVNEDESVIIDVLANDTDINGNDLSIASASAQNGTVVVNVDGTLTYTPNANFNGQDTLTYSVSDGLDESSATVDITVFPQNDVPQANDDAININETGVVTLNVLANDLNPDGDVLTITSATANNGTVVINSDGTLSYTANSAVEGLDTVTYEISDTNGATSSATVIVNRLPVVENESASTDQNTGVTIDVLSNDRDADGQVLSVSSASAANGSVTINGDGSLDYIPNLDYSGSDTITYTVSDNAGGFVNGSVSLSVLDSSNAAPVAVDDVATVEAGTNSTIANFIFVTEPIPSLEDNRLLSNDTDADGDTLTITHVDGQSLNGAAIIVPGSNGGFFKVFPNGQAEFDATTGFEGILPGSQETSSITYTVSDGQGGTDTATVTVTIQAPNASPVAQNDSVSVDEDGSINIDVLANDTDPDGDSLTVSNASAANGSVSINTDGSITYSPNADFSGQDTIAYEVSDGNGGTSNAEVTVTVNAMNDDPVARNNTATVNENSSVIINVLANDTDADGDSLTVSSAVASNGAVVINTDGTVTYTPNTDFNGQDTIVYEISDGQGGSATAQVAVTVNVDTNTAPVAVDDVATVEAGTNSPIANFIFVTEPIPALEDNRLLSNDSDADGDILTITQVDGQDLNGSVITVPGSNGGFFKVYPNGQAEFDATSGFENVAEGATATSSITYTVSDGQGGTDTATVTVTINGVNDNPNAVADSASTDESSSVVIDVLSNDSDVDGDALSISNIDTSNLSGQLVDNGDGTFTYDANQQFDYLNDGETATDFFDYTIDDGMGGLDTAQVMITIQGSTVNVTPSAAPESSSSADSTIPDDSDDGSNDFMV